jgi:hypothetical protein
MKREDLYEGLGYPMRHTAPQALQGLCKRDQHRLKPTRSHASADDVRVVIHLHHSNIPRHGHHLLSRPIREFTM